MRTQLTILLSTLQSKWSMALSVIAAFLMPISGLLFLIGFSIMIDTITGNWKSKKHGVKLESRALAAIISKMLLYEITVILFFLIDKFILNDIMLQFFSVPLMLTKIMALILVSIEVMSINENYKAVKGLDLWQAMKNLFARAKDVKKEVDGIRHNEDITGTPI
jgi:hypothetical protein